MPFISFLQRETQPEEFVRFWAPVYKYAGEDVYVADIGAELTPDRIFRLFRWKNGGNLSEKKKASVQRNFVERRADLARFTGNYSARGFLEHFPTGGAIWRVFWLHCHRPEFPIYDQHVHRAMVYVQTGRIEEIASNDDAKINCYLDRYVQFHAEFVGLDGGREVDKALWAFGKFLKESNFEFA